jgi:hypothetical protein
MSKQEKDLMRDIKRRWAVKYSLGELYCFLCGKQILEGEKYNADHWIPKALGGKTTEENLKPAHVSCNSKKACISPEIFLEHKEEILSGSYKVVEPYKINKKHKKRKDKYEYSIGSPTYYLEELQNEPLPKFEVKEGIIIGFTYKDSVEYALVKDFYIINDKEESKLIEVLPLSKQQAYILKKSYENQI